MPNQISIITGEPMQISIPQKDIMYAAAFYFTFGPHFHSSTPLQF